MTVTKVLLKDVLQDIRSGMDEGAIRRKYNLSPHGVKHLYERLIESKLLDFDVQSVPRKLNIAQVLRDIRAGMSNADLMNKYSLSEDMLRQASKKILDARGKRSTEDDPETLIQERPEFLATSEFVRHEVDFKLPVYDTSLPEIHGTVRDISEEGLSVLGIEANMGEVKTLVILGDEFGQFSSFEFEGFCRWRFSDPDDGMCLTGFAINKISADDYRQLHKLIHVVTTGG